MSSASEDDYQDDQYESEGFVESGGDSDFEEAPLPKVH